jgi:hypothetical protein
MTKCEKPYLTLIKKPLSLYKATILYTHNCLSPPAGLLTLPTKPYCHKMFKVLIKSLQSHLQLVYKFMYTTYIKYNGYLGSFSGGKWPACNSDNLPPSSDEGTQYTYKPTFPLSAFWLLQDKLFIHWIKREPAYCSWYNNYTTQ